MLKLIKRIKFSTVENSKKIRFLSEYPTVCEYSRCPNKAECFQNGVATFLVMGSICTRNCLYCRVEHGKPLPVDPMEKEKIVKAIENLSSKHVVLTSVERDDLADGGAGHLLEISKRLKEKFSDINNKTSLKLEILLPDFKGNSNAWKIIAKAPLDVFSHNIETVKSIFKKIRPGGNWQRSIKFLSFLANEKKSDGTKALIKSGFMLGFGEKAGEVFSLMDILLEAGVQLLTIGQYLPPGKGNFFPIKEIVPEAIFEKYKLIGQKKGFLHVAASPFVRSSYLAHKIWENNSKNVI